MLTIDELTEPEGLDEYDRSRASDMDESRPIYPNLIRPSNDTPDDEESNPGETEL